MRVFATLILANLLVSNALDNNEEKSLRGGQLTPEMGVDEDFDAFLEKHRKLGPYDAPKFIGCYADTEDRALTLYVGRELDLETCKQECTKMGAPMFGRQSWGECWCGGSGFSKHGRSKGCDCDSTGNIGAWTQCIYLVEEYVGCYNDQADRALPYYVGAGKTDKECSRACRMQGYHFMARQDRDDCWCGGESPVDGSYAKHGVASNCDCSSAAVGAYTNCVYRVTGSALKGCYNDTPDRALPYNPGKEMSFDECYAACKDKGYTLMGRQANEECWCGGEYWFDTSYKKYGPAIGCECHGHYVGFWKQCVYRVPNRDENGKIEK